jgi:hypothetical protein
VVGGRARSAFSFPCHSVVSDKSYCFCMQYQYRYIYAFAIVLLDNLLYPAFFVSGFIFFFSLSFAAIFFSSSFSNLYSYNGTNMAFFPGGVVFNLERGVSRSINDLYFPLLI